MQSAHIFWTCMGDYQMGGFFMETNSSISHYIQIFEIAVPNTDFFSNLQCNTVNSWRNVCKLPRLKLNLGLEIFGNIHVNMEENSSVCGSVLMSFWPKPMSVSDSLLGRQFCRSSPETDVMLFTIPYNSSVSILLKSRDYKRNRIKRLVYEKKILPVQNFYNF